MTADWTTAQVPNPQTAWEKLLSRSVRDPETNCLRWLGSHTKDGYGTVRFNKVHYRTHRLAWMLQCGPIPDDLVIDHVLARGCQYRDCFEVEHMELVTRAENMARSKPAHKTHCKQGHELTPENTIIRNERGWRQCRECKRNHETEVVTCGCGSSFQRWSKHCHRRTCQMDMLEAS